MLGVNRVLRHARARITDRTSWTTGAEARDTEGREVDALARAAACWDVGGAIRREARSPDLYRAAVLALADAIGTTWPDDDGDADIAAAAAVSELNDHHGHSTVLVALDRAIRHTNDTTKRTDR